MPSFAVVATVKETEAILRRFSDYYLRLGAEDIHLLYDGEEDEARANGLYNITARDPRIRAMLTDQAFWQDLNGSRPKVLTARQEILFAWAHAQNEA